MTALSYTRSWARAASSTCNVGSIIAPSAGFLRQPLLQRAEHPLRTPARLRRIGRNMLDPKPIKRASDLRELAPVNSLARLRRVEIMAAAIGIEARHKPLRREHLQQPTKRRNRAFFLDQERRVDRARGIVHRHNQIKLG